MDPVVKPRGDTQWILPVHAIMPPRNDDLVSTQQI
ncbi:MAG: hypothetical protein AB8U84_04785 [Rickettsia endosymbiont of Haemaphysalis japonica]